ncbi:sugar transferase [Ruminococcus sp. AM27-11LB]|uniref:sugar transferase n=1 Tax=Mediterraneibacter TaxID=2316020 RepID=UPI000E4A60DC|nr:MULTISPECIES: sugar transferase [Mediterraneibacter]RGH93373.1 sugar transferase [Ruminococcus sp. AM27-27]RGH97285.1 sugar transferase [Ruminococcus sp. AM27-11LB]
MKKWDEIPVFMKNEQVKYYYNILKKKEQQIRIKRIFDLVMAVGLIIVLAPFMLAISVAIKMDSPGPVIFKQVRITTYGRKFYIYKFRTMVAGADKIGSKVTVQGDSRITKIGEFLRKYRLDEIPQLFNVLIGDMSFVGTRPEVEKYVHQYNDAMKATLLMPAGITSLASIKYKDEDQLLRNAENTDEEYVKIVLPEKMKYNLKALEEFDIFSDLKTMIATVFAVVR